MSCNQRLPLSCQHKLARWALSVSPAAAGAAVATPDLLCSPSAACAAVVTTRCYPDPFSRCCSDGGVTSNSNNHTNTRQGKLAAPNNGYQRQQ